jgi:hypothetical protein
LIIFGQSCFVPRPAWRVILLFVLPWVAEKTSVTHWVQPLVELGSLKLFPPPCWPRTEILPISASQVVRIIGVSCHTQLMLHIFEELFSAILFFHRG